jgi:hypothetical protein
VTDLTQQLASEKSKVKEVESHLEAQRDINRGLQEQISLLEQRVQSEEARSKEVKVCCMIGVLVQSLLVISCSNLIICLLNNTAWDISVSGVGGIRDVILKQVLSS